MRIAVVLTFAALMTVGLATEAAAQRVPSGAPQVDIGAPSHRGTVGQDRPWSGPPKVKFDQPRARGRAYFEPTRRPFQSSHTRRWQQKLDQQWGGLSTDRRIPRVERRFGFPRNPSGTVFTHPQPWPIIEHFDTRAPRAWPPMR